MDIENLLIPRLDPKEVAAVFSVPFESFLHSKLPIQETDSAEQVWYKGKLQSWYGRDWYMHEFFSPVKSTMSNIKADLAQRDPEREEHIPSDAHYRIWGMTARILVDAARAAYGREPDFECCEESGDEDMISALWEHGMLRGERVAGEEFVVSDMFKNGIKGNL